MSWTHVSQLLKKGNFILNKCESTFLYDHVYFLLNMINNDIITYQ
jgi:hypothetical protein